MSISLSKAGDLKYQKTVGDTEAAKSGEWLTVRMRYKQPGTDASKELTATIPEHGVSQRPSGDFRFAGAVAAFGMILNDSEYKGEATLAKVRDWANEPLGADPNGWRSEFVRLVNQAQRLKR